DRAVAAQCGSAQWRTVRRGGVWAGPPGDRRGREPGAAADDLAGACGEHGLHAGPAAPADAPAQRRDFAGHPGHLVAAVLPVLWRHDLGRHRPPADRRPLRRRHGTDRVRRRPAAGGLDRRTGAPRHRAALRHPARGGPRGAAHLRRKRRRVLLMSTQASGGTPMNGLLGYCRQGFEPELAAELGERAAGAGIAGYARASRDDGYVLFVTGDAADARVLARALPFSELVFARQKLRLLGELRGLDPKDRLTPLLAALPADLRAGDVWVE